MSFNYNYYLICSVGICLILKYGSILNSIKEQSIQKYPILEKLYQCCLCMGFWVGLLLTPFIFFVEKCGVGIILFPFSVSFYGFLFDSIITVIHTVNNYLLSSEKSAPNK
jgi:hypothetical protein